MTSGTEETIAAVGVHAAHASSSGLRTGGTVGRYVVIEPLGAGGMGVVYAAYDPQLDRKIALKLLHSHRATAQTAGHVHAKVMHGLFGDQPPSPPSEASSDQARLLREAQAVAKINHPNVVTVHDVGQHLGVVFIAMEYVDGTTLGAWLRESSRSLAATLEVMRQAGAGLAAAHERGLVHRDFKPDNVMIDRSGRARVMDFGLVCSDESPSGAGELQPDSDALGMALTRDGAVMGTPAYMSPEQYLGGAVGPASDQFSFCVTLWEALYGERPFKGTSMQSLAVAVTQGVRAPPPDDARVPVHVRLVLERGLQTDADARHSSMAALLADLARNPARTRRWIVLGGSALAIAATAIGVREVDQRHTRARCREDGASIGEVWGDEVAARVQTAMLDTGLPFAATAFGKAKPWLDGYAEAWTATRIQACEADALHHDPQATRTLECLDERAVELGRLVRVLTERPRENLRAAVKHAAELQAIADCSDPRQLELRERWPEDPQLAEQARALNHRMVEASRFQDTGQHEAALAILHGAAAEASALGLDVLAGRIVYMEGVFSEQKADYAEAERVLADAALALVRAGADGYAADAAVRLALVIAERQSRHDEGLVWGRWAEALLARAGEADGLRAAELHNHLGLIADTHGDLEDALRRHERALEIAEALLEPAHPRIGTYLNNVGTMHSKLGHGDVAVSFYERALAVSESALGPDHPDNALPLNNIAKIHWQRGELAAARKAMERSLAIQEAAFGSEHPQVGVSIGNLAIIVRELGDTEGALELHERALAIVEAGLPANHIQVVRALVNLGETRRLLGDFARARADLERALAVLEGSVGPDHIEVAVVLGSLALVLHSVGDLAGALPMFERAAAIYEKTVGKEHLDYGLVLLELGHTRLEHGDPAGAVEPLRNAKEVLDAANASGNPRGRARFLLARALAESGGEPREAVELAREALPLVENAERPDAEVAAAVRAWLAAASGG